jgi:WD40 repeat protein
MSFFFVLSCQVYALDWAPGKEQVLSVSQDGLAIVWNALTGQKMHALNLICSWMMTGAFSPSGKLIACGGLDCVVSIYTINSQKRGVTYESKVLCGHKSYVSGCKFVPNSDNQIITSSADGTCALWDIESGQKIISFGGNSASGHLKDVLW